MSQSAVRIASSQPAGRSTPASVQTSRSERATRMPVLRAAPTGVHRGPDREATAGRLPAGPGGPAVSSCRGVVDDHQLVAVRAGHRPRRPPPRRCRRSSKTGTTHAHGRPSTTRPAPGRRAASASTPARARRRTRVASGGRGRARGPLARPGRPARGATAAPGPQRARERVARGHDEHRPGRQAPLDGAARHRDTGTPAAIASIAVMPKPSPIGSARTGRPGEYRERVEGRSPVSGAWPVGRRGGRARRRRGRRPAPAADAPRPARRVIATQHASRQRQAMAAGSASARIGLVDALVGDQPGEHRRGPGPRPAARPSVDERGPRAVGRLRPRVGRGRHDNGVGPVDRRQHFLGGPTTRVGRTSQPPHRGLERVVVPDEDAEEPPRAGPPARRRTAPSPRWPGRRPGRARRSRRGSRATGTARDSRPRCPPGARRPAGRAARAACGAPRPGAGGPARRAGRWRRAAAAATPPGRRARRAAPRRGPPAAGGAGPRAAGGARSGAPRGPRRTGRARARAPGGRGRPRGPGCPT